MGACETVGLTQGVGVGCFNDYNNHKSHNNRNGHNHRCGHEAVATTQ